MTIILGKKKQRSKKGGKPEPNGESYSQFLLTIAIWFEGNNI